VTKRLLYITLIKKLPDMKNTPYWNFWRVVFAGWLIRYPGKVIRPIGVLLGILIVIIYNAVSN